MDNLTNEQAHLRINEIVNRQIEIRDLMLKLLDEVEALEREYDQINESLNDRK